jgi:hypothetical protein
MLKPEPFEPNLKAIAQSDIWRDQIEPMLEKLYFEMLEGQWCVGGTRFENGQTPTLEDFHFHRGGASAIRAILEDVNRGSALKTMADTTEKTDEYQGQYDDRQLAARRARA